MKGKVGKSADKEVAADAGNPLALAEVATRLFAQQAAAMASLAAYNFSLTSQLAGAFFGSVADAIETSRKIETSRETAEPMKEEARVLPLKVVATKARPAARQPARPAPAARDDLKVISGIGPRLEKALNGMGITRYADIAAMSKDDMRKLDAGLGLDNRAIRDDWAGQAKALLEG